MVKILILICCLLSLVQMSFGQENDDEFIEEAHYTTHFVNEKYNLDFTTYLNQQNSDSLNQLLNNQVAYVKLVSLSPVKNFKGSLKNPVEYEEFETAIYFDRITLGGVDENRFKTSVVVDSSTIQEIILLYYQKNTDSIQDYLYSACYNPRHGIVFYNRSDKIIAYLEVCFECFGTSSTGIFPSYNGFNYKQFKQLKNIFRKFMLDYFEPTN